MLMSTCLVVRNRFLRVIVIVSQVMKGQPVQARSRPLQRHHLVIHEVQTHGPEAGQPVASTKSHGRSESKGNQKD